MIIFIGLLLTSMKKITRFITTTAFSTILLLVIIGVLFLITGFMYGSNAHYQSELKAYCAVVTNIILLILIIDNYCIKNINLKLILVFETILTFVVSFAVFQSNGITSGGLIQDSSGLLYQNTSYYAAYALAMNLFLIGEQKYNIKPKFVKSIFGYVISVYQLLLCLLAGGRGGVVLALILILYFVISQKGWKSFFYLLLLLITGYFLIPIVIRFVSQEFNVNTTGLERTINLLTTGFSDTNRLELRNMSINIFFDSPLCGHGVGSIFYLIGTYSHNCFTDILVETGFLGFTIFISILLIGMLNAFKLFSKGSLYRFLLFIFICGFTMSLFSGYIWVNQQVWLPILIFIISLKK